MISYSILNISDVLFLARIFCSLPAGHMSLSSLDLSAPRLSRLITFSTSALHITLLSQPQHHHTDGKQLSGSYCSTVGYWRLKDLHSLDSCFSYLNESMHLLKCFSVSTSGVLGLLIPIPAATNHMWPQRSEAGVKQEGGDLKGRDQDWKATGPAGE